MLFLSVLKMIWVEAPTINQLEYIQVNQLNNAIHPPLAKNLLIPPPGKIPPSRLPPPTKFLSPPYQRLILPLPLPLNNNFQVITR